MIMIPPRIRNMMDIIDRLFVVVYASARIGQNMFNLQTSTDTSLAPIFICTTETDVFIVLNVYPFTGVTFPLLIGKFWIVLHVQFGWHHKGSDSEHSSSFM